MNLQPWAWLTWTDGRGSGDRRGRRRRARTDDVRRPAAVAGEGRGGGMARGLRRAAKPQSSVATRLWLVSHRNPSLRGSKGRRSSSRVTKTLPASVFALLWVLASASWKVLWPMFVRPVFYACRDRRRFLLRLHIRCARGERRSCRRCCDRLIGTRKSATERIPRDGRRLRDALPPPLLDLKAQSPSAILLLLLSSSSTLLLFSALLKNWISHTVVSVIGKALKFTHYVFFSSTPR